MQQLLSIIAAAGALAMPQAGISTSAPVLVSTCSVSDLYDSAGMAEFGTPITLRLLRLSFLNTDDTAATQVTFDIAHDGTHTKVIDRGRFSRGVAIDHLFDDVTAPNGSGRAQCSVAAVTFADGRRWVAPAPSTVRSDRSFQPDFSRALTVDQMNRAWQAELDRLNPPVVTGGG
jgi:hypothetical protein